MLFYKFKYFWLFISFGIVICGNLSAENINRTKAKEFFRLAESNKLYSIAETYRLADSAYKYAWHSNDFNLESDALMLKGTAMIDFGRFKEALDTLKLSLKRFESTFEITGIARNYALIGRAYTQLGMYQLATDYFDKAKKIYDSVGIDNLIYRKKVYYDLARLYNFFGLLHKRIDNEKIALEYHRKEFKIYSDLNDSLMMGACLGDIGRIFRYMNLLDSAFDYTYRGYEIVKKSGQTIYLAHIEKKLGLIEIENENYLDALKYLDTALSKYIRFQDNQGIVVCKNNIGRIYSHIRKFELAHKFIDEALLLATEINDADDLQYSYLFKADAYSLNNQPNEALEMYKKYYSLRDTLYKIEKEKFISELEIRYKYKEQVNKIQLLQAKSDSVLFYSIVSISLILLIVIALLYSRYKIKEELNLSLMANNSELNKVYEDAIVSKQEVETLINVKQNMIKNISAELSTPFNIIFGYLNLLRIEIKQYANTTATKYIEQITTNANSLLGTINDIAELNKLDNSEYQLNKNEFLLADLFDSVSEIMSPKAIEKQLEISFTCPNTISINTDFKILERILIHLIDNSIKYTSVGAIKISADIKRSFEALDIVISIEDTGIGMSEQKINYILSGHINQNSNNQGSDDIFGLGLTITKNFIELLGARLEIFSEKEKGTKINVYLCSEK